MAPLQVTDLTGPGLAAAAPLLAGFDAGHWAQPRRAPVAGRWGWAQPRRS